MPGSGQLEWKHMHNGMQAHTQAIANTNSGGAQIEVAAKGLQAVLETKFGFNVMGRPEDCKMSANTGDRCTECTVETPRPISTYGSTCAWSPWNALSTAASLPRMAAKGFRGGKDSCRGAWNCSPSSSSRSMRRRERPNSVVCREASESKRSIRARRLPHSSCSSHLQYISIRGRRSMQVARTTWRDGGQEERSLQQTS